MAPQEVLLDVRGANPGHRLGDDALTTSSACIGPFVEFAFSSRVAAGLPEAALLRLAQQAALFNARRGITGTLRLADGRFTQVIEGAGDAMLPLVARILTDRRHGQIEVLSFRPIAARRFADWNCAGIAASGTLSAGVAAAADLCLMPLIAAIAGKGAAVATRGASVAP